MNYNNSENSESVITQNNSQKTTLNANDAQSIVTWSKGQLEILQQCHEKEIANDMMYDSIPSHVFTCNCTECN